MFNSLKYTKVLEEVGIPRTHAEAHIQIMTEIIDSELATKNDIKDLRTEIRELKTELKNDMTQLEHRLVFTLGTIVTIVMTSIATVMTLVLKLSLSVH